jgi:cell wall-associated NlpC family hydrolase
MVTRAQIVAEARGWINTRWQHQAHLKGVATDCGGMIYGVGLQLGLLRPVHEMPEAAFFRGYGRLANNGSMLKACSILLQRIDVAFASHGDVVLMLFDNEPQHVGLLGDYVHGGLSIIHAYARMRKVVESRFDDQFRAKVIAAFSYPGVEA